MVSDEVEVHQEDAGEEVDRSIRKTLDRQKQ